MKRRRTTDRGRAAARRAGGPRDRHVTDLLPSYALGILEDAETMRIGDHLRGCLSCRDELASLEAAVDRLALAAPREQPPDSLERRILARIRVTERDRIGGAERGRGDLPGRAHEAAGLRLAANRAFGIVTSRAFAPLAAAACLVAAVTLAGVNVGLGRELRRMQDRTEPAQAVIAVFSATASAPGAGGVLLAGHDSRSGTLVVRGLAALDQDRQYQLWLIKDGARTSGGVFSIAPDGVGILAISAPLPLTQYPVFGITIEPAGGSPGPTGSKVLGSSL